MHRIRILLYKIYTYINTFYVEVRLFGTVCVAQLVGRQTIHLYISRYQEFVYSIQYPRVVILGNKNTCTAQRN